MPAGERSLRRHWPWPFVLCGWLLGSVEAVPAAGDPVAGEAKSEVCIGCHGRGGRSLHPRYPHLAGQKAHYLIKSLRAYRDGTRRDPAMSPFAAGLSDADIADLAAYYSRTR